ncbi:MAG: hypothetical protein ABWX65_12320 [Mycetocola sp.]
MFEHTEKPGSDQHGVEVTPPAGSSIPDSDSGVAAGYTGEPSTFEPEEDVPASDTSADPDSEAGEETDDAQGGTGPRSTEATALSSEDRSIFQSHWDDFAGHVD